jgi:uncharacterized coiled-coil protein SlyX
LEGRTNKRIDCCTAVATRTQQAVKEIIHADCPQLRPSQSANRWPPLSAPHWNEAKSGSSERRVMSEIRQELHDALIEQIVGLQIRIGLQSERIAELERQICELREFIEHVQHLLPNDAALAREMLSKGKKG